MIGVPLVLAMNEDSESGISYDDLPYVSYEYPSNYRNQIRPGERFVYYRGRRKAGGGRQPQVYLGTGVVGEIRTSGESGRFVCEILDGQPFREPVYFKDEGGAPLEPGGHRRGYYQRGVRRVDDEVFAEILRRAQPGIPPEIEEGSETARPSALYASSMVARALEQYSRRVIVRRLRQHFSDCTVQEMPLNHPGFDLLTDIAGLRHVEVKATQAALPRFILSEGERRFANENADHYSLVVVYGIDLEAETHVGEAWSQGGLEHETGLRPIQWAGTLPSDGSL